MPAHYPTIEPEQIWDLVNFVLALPYEPKLLEGATLPAAAAATAAPRWPGAERYRDGSTRPRLRRDRSPAQLSGACWPARPPVRPSSRRSCPEPIRERIRALLESPVRPGRAVLRRRVRLRAVRPRLVAPEPRGRARTTSVSTFGRDIDSLFVIILWITGIVFIGTQIVLVWAAWRFVDGPGRVATYFHGSQRLEVIWTIIPAVDPGLHRPLPDGDLGRASSSASAAPKVQPLAEVTGRQFQWVMRYPGPDGKLHTPDDLHHGQRPALRQGQRWP